MLGPTRAQHPLPDGERVDVDGEFLTLHLDPPRIRATGAAPFSSGGGMSPAACEVAAQAADVLLVWPDIHRHARRPARPRRRPRPHHVPPTS